MPNLLSRETLDIGDVISSTPTWGNWGQLNVKDDASGEAMLVVYSKQGATEVEVNIVGDSASGVAWIGTSSNHPLYLMANWQAQWEVQAGGDLVSDRNLQGIQCGYLDLTNPGGGAPTTNYFQSGYGSGVAVSPAGKGRIRYNESANKWQFSENGGAYLDFGAGGLTIGSAISSGSSNRVLYEDGTNNLAESANLQFDGSVLTLKGTLGHAGATSGTLSHVVPATVTSYSLTWPSAVAGGAGYRLVSDASGNLSWVAPGSGSTLTIGDPISSGTANRVLFENASNQLGESANLTWNGSSFGIGATASTTGTPSPLVVVTVPTHSNLAAANTVLGYDLGYSGTIGIAGSTVVPNLFGVRIQRPTLDGVDPGSDVTNFASLYIEGPAQVTGEADPDIANNWAFWVDAGTARIDDTLNVGFGVQFDGATSGWLLQRAADVTTSYTVKWPAAQASGTQVLQNDGAGNLSWATVGGGSLTIGDSITSGTANRLLYEDASNQLAESANLTFNGSSLGLKGTLVHLGATTGTLTHAVPASITTYSLTWPSAVAGGAQYRLVSDASGNLSWAAPGSGSTLTIGDPISSGTANRVLYQNASNQLAESANLTFNGSSLGLTGTLVHNGATSGSLSHAVPASVTTYTVTWPSAQGSGYLTNNGSGTLSWSSTATPSSHASTHQNGGGDEISVAGLSGVLADYQKANVIRTSTGPTDLTVGAIADGEVLTRSGTTIVGTTPGGGGLTIGDPITSGTANRVLFQGATNLLAQDSGFVYNASQQSLIMNVNSGFFTIDIDQAGTGLGLIVTTTNAAGRAAYFLDSGGLTSNDLVTILANTAGRTQAALRCSSSGSLSGYLVHLSHGTLNTGDVLYITRQGSGRGVHVVAGYGTSTPAFEVSDAGSGDSGPQIKLTRNLAGTSGKAIEIVYGGTNEALSIDLNTNQGAKGIVITESDQQADFMLSLQRTNASSAGDVIALTNAGSGNSLDIAHTGSQDVVLINNDGSANGIDIVQSGQGDAINITLDSNTSAQALVIFSSLAGLADTVSITRTSSSYTGECLYVSNAGSSYAVNIEQSGTGHPLRLANSGTSGNALIISSTISGASAIVSISHTFTTSAPRAVDITHNGTGHGIFITLGNATNGSSGLVVEHSGTGNAIECATDAFRVTAKGRCIVNAPAETNPVLQGIQDTAYNTNVCFIKANNSTTYTANVLEVVCNRASGSGFDLAEFQSAGSADREFRFRGDGQAYADLGWTTPAADYAEYIEVTQDAATYEAGDVLVVNGEDEFEKSSSPNSPAIAGVYSTSPAIVGNTTYHNYDQNSGTVEAAPWHMSKSNPNAPLTENGGFDQLVFDGNQSANYAVDSLVLVSKTETKVTAVSYDAGNDETTVTLDETFAVDLATDPNVPTPTIKYGLVLRNCVPMAMLGRVPCKVITENGSIAPGDLLVTSSTTGHAMKAGGSPSAGTILGKALGTLTDIDGTQTAQILVYVNLM